MRYFAFLASNAKGTFIKKFVADGEFNSAEEARDSFNKEMLLKIEMFLMTNPVADVDSVIFVPETDLEKYGVSNPRAFATN